MTNGGPKGPPLRMRMPVEPLAMQLITVLWLQLALSYRYRCRDHCKIMTLPPWSLNQRAA